MAMAQSIATVVTAGSVTQINRPIVVSDPILVTDLTTVGHWANERQSDELMHARSTNNTLHTQNHTSVTSLLGGLQDLHVPAASLEAADSTLVTNLIVTKVARNVAPFFFHGLTVPLVYDEGTVSDHEADLVASADPLDPHLGLVLLRHALEQRHVLVVEQRTVGYADHAHLRVQGHC